MQSDISAFMPLPPTPYDACHKIATRVSSMSLVRYRNNDYSVPTRYGHQEVLAKGYVDRVEIVCRGETVAVHARSTFAREYEKVALESAQDRADYPRYLLRLCELERIDRERRNVERRIRLARFTPELFEPRLWTHGVRPLLRHDHDRQRDHSHLSFHNVTKPSIKLDEEEAVAVRKRYSAFHLPLQHNQLLPERSVLGLKLAL